MNLYSIVLNFWYHDPTSTKTYAQQTIDALDRKPDSTITMKMLAPHKAEVYHALRRMYGRQLEVIQWEAVSINLINRNFEVITSEALDQDSPA